MKPSDRINELADMFALVQVNTYKEKTLDFVQKIMPVSDEELFKMFRSDAKIICVAISAYLDEAAGSSQWEAGNVIKQFVDLGVLTVPPPTPPPPSDSSPPPES